MTVATTTQPILACSPDEAAARLGVSRALIFKLLNDGTLRSVKLGRCRRIPLAAIDELLEGQPA